MVLSLIFALVLFALVLFVSCIHFRSVCGRFYFIFSAFSFSHVQAFVARFWMFMALFSIFVLFHLSVFLSVYFSIFIYLLNRRFSKNKISSHWLLVRISSAVPTNFSWKWFCTLTNVIVNFIQNLHCDIHKHQNRYKNDAELHFCYYYFSVILLFLFVIFHFSIF